MATKHQPERTVGGMTNGERAEIALIPLVPFARHVYRGEYGEDLVTTTGDMLSYILHYAASLGMDPHRFLGQVTEMALGHYEAETEDEPDENDEVSEFLEEPPYNPDDWLIEQPRHFIVTGRIPGADDDHSAHVTVEHGDDRSAWEVFVEDHLYGTVYEVEDWHDYHAKHGFYPEQGIPADWGERDPEQPAEARYESWAYFVSEHEIPGEPVGSDIQRDY